MSHIQPDTTLPKTPRIKLYTCLLSQVGTAAPTAIVLQNTLGVNVVWTRAAAGQYVATATGTFTANKTWAAQPKAEGVNHLVAYALVRTGDNAIEFRTAYNDVSSDDLAAGTCIEIRVYE